MRSARCARVGTHLAKRDGYATTLSPDRRAGARRLGLCDGGRRLRGRHGCRLCGCGSLAAAGTGVGIDRGENLFILDVRNPPEYQICQIPGSVLLPLPELPARMQELDRSREMSVHCKSGVRIARAIQFLRQQGFEKMSNLKGGILAWADNIDPVMARY